jgi:hypothetical protein
MNAQFTADLLHDSMSLFMRFQTRIYITFDYETIAIHAIDNANISYTKIVIKESEMNFYINCYMERRTFLGNLSRGYLSILPF